MTLDHPALLFLLLLLPVLWLWMQRAPGASRVCLALKCAAFSALVIALAGPWAVIRVDKLAVTVLMDTSASMSRDSLERGEAMLRDLVRKRSGAELRLVTFARGPRLRPVPPQANDVTIPQGIDPSDGMVTDLEAALNLALSTFPAEGARRVLLISDGNENRGHVLTEALRARERGVAVFTVPAGGTAPLPVKVESVASLQNVFSGEHFTLSLRLESARPLPVRVWITSQDQEIGATALSLEAGTNAVDLDARITRSGVHLMEVYISSAGAEQMLFSQAVAVRRPRVLYISGDGGVSAPLLDTLKRAQVDVETAGAFPTDPKQQDWDAVLLDNYPDHELPEDEDAALAKYVFMGGGLIFIAGDRNAGLARDPKTPFEKMLPVRAQLPPQKPVAVVLVLDKSGSMEGQKIQMVRAAARASLGTLRPIDKIGVMFFDATQEWVVPLGLAVDLASKGDVVDGVQPGGDTMLYQAAEAAFQALLGEDGISKHMILLTDGVQTYKTFSDFPQLQSNAAARNVTISTIGVGADVNRELLEEVARATKGKSHFVKNLELIPQIINDEVRSVEDLAIQERPVSAVRVQPVEFIDGIDFTQAPRLLGFVQAEAKDDTETILRVDDDKPLLVRWHYGLGRAIAFMSDAKSRWAAPWVQWESFGTLWPQMVRDISRRDKTVRAGVRVGSREGEVIVYYDVLKQADTQMKVDLSLPGHPSIVVEVPEGAPQALPLEETVPGHYEARISVSQPGLYRIMPGSPELGLPDVGFYRELEETRMQTVNVALLSEVSRLTGGHVRPSVDQLLNTSGNSVSERRPLWPYWLLLALAINFVEVAIRKGFFERLISWLQRRTLLPWGRQPA